MGRTERVVHFNLECFSVYCNFGNTAFYIFDVDFVVNALNFIFILFHCISDILSCYSWNWDICIPLAFQLESCGVMVMILLSISCISSSYSFKAMAMTAI